MKLSIVITYYNRRKQLLNTLHSIGLFIMRGYPIQVIIVDDDSDEEERIIDIFELFPFVEKLLVLKHRQRHDPVVPLNTGFNEVTGDVILINCAECMHMGDIIGYIYKNFDPGSYFNFGTYSIDHNLTGKFFKLDWSKENTLARARKLISPTHSLPEKWKDGDTGWYVDLSKEHYSLLPFCAAISRDAIECLSGLDERFIDGIGYADTDFAIRLQNLGLNTRIIMDPFCVHQAHSPTVYEKEGFARNNKLIASLQGDFPERIRAPFNNVYKR